MCAAGVASPKFVSVHCCESSEAGQLTDALVCLTAGLPERLLTTPPRSTIKSRNLPKIDTNE